MSKKKEEAEKEKPKKTTTAKKKKEEASTPLDELVEDAYQSVLEEDEVKTLKLKLLLLNPCQIAFHPAFMALIFSHIPGDLIYFFQEHGKVLLSMGS